jgi:hypothetical protein
MWNFTAGMRWSVRWTGGRWRNDEILDKKHSAPHHPGFRCFLLANRRTFFEKSGLSNCVVVDHEADFTGEWLKHSRYVSFERKPTPKCIEKDRQIDQGDGSIKGKVRWAECTFGPDCDEAGMF